MPESTEPVTTATECDPTMGRDDPVTERVRTTAGLSALVAEAEAVWRSRTGATSGGRHRAAAEAVAEPARPVWRPFEDAFPTFYQFTNRPRR